MRLLEVLRPILRQKLMEGQADQIIDQGVKSLEKLVNNLPSVSKELDDEWVNDSPTLRDSLEVLDHVQSEWKRWRSELNNANVPNSWKIFVAKAWIASAIDHILHKIDSDHLPRHKLEKLMKKTEMVRGAMNINPWYINQLIHFSGIDYPPIQNFNPVLFTEQGHNIGDVLDRLNELEKEYGERQTFIQKLVPITGDENWILEVGEYKWLDLNHWCSRADATAMRHCGNVPYGNRTDRVYTLNSIVQYEGKTYRQPWVFIVIQEGGIMGERKSYLNSKPLPEHHRAIIEFIKLPIVKYMKSDARHLSSNDFQLTDISEAEVEEIRQAKGDNFVDFVKWGLNEDEIKAIHEFKENGKLTVKLLEMEGYVEKNKEEVDKVAHQTFNRIIDGDVVESDEVQAAFTYNLEWAEIAYNTESHGDDYDRVVKDEAFQFLIEDTDWREDYIEQLIHNPENVLDGNQNVLQHIDMLHDHHLSEDQIFEIFQNETFLKKYGTSQYLLHGSQLAAASNKDAFYMHIGDRSELSRFIHSDNDTFVEEMLSDDGFEYFMSDGNIVDRLSNVSIWDHTENREEGEKRCIKLVKDALTEIFGEDLNKYFEPGDFNSFESLISEIETVQSDIDDDESSDEGEDYLPDLEGLIDNIKIAISNAQDQADESAAMKSLYNTLEEAGINEFVYDHESKIEYAEIDTELAAALLMEEEGYGDFDDYIDLPSFHSPQYGWNGDIEYINLADNLAGYI